MRKSFKKFLSSYLNNFFEAIINLFIFLPYFFSILTLFKTLFNPWKNIVDSKKNISFSWSDWINRLSFNFISRMMGLIMRISIISFYLLLQLLFVLAIPFIMIIYLFFMPLMFVMDRFFPTEEERKNKLKKYFISIHLLDQKNLSIVSAWFEEHYNKTEKKTQWWKLSNLMSMPPLARDWSVGYTPLLDQFSQELSKISYQKKFKHIVDREKEIEQIERILSKSEEANVVIVGEEGVGKHTIIDAFAKKLYEGNTNSSLLYKRVLKINMEKIISSYSDQTQREQFIEELLEEAACANNIVVIIDKIDKYITTDNNHVDLTTSIEKYAKQSNLQIVGITTPFFYQKYIYTNERLNRLFTKIDVQEIAKEEAIKILMDKYDIFEQRYKVIIPYETLIEIIDKSSFYITNIPFPEKAMQLLDEACIYAVQKLHKTHISTDIINTILSEKTHIQIDLTQDLKNKLINLEELLSNQIVEQKNAVDELALSLRNAFVLREKRKKPLASLLFLGPTGVGKTETAKVVAKIFFGSEKELTRFDMSFYQTKEDIHQLIGSQETGNPGLLSLAVREKPYSVLLLDEIEKADKNLLNIFLTVFDEGYFVDSYGKKVDCKNMIIIATSNAGSDFIFKQSQLSQFLSSKDIIPILIEKNIFTPEFLNRFDGIVVYNPLSPDGVYKIGLKIMTDITNQITDLHKIKVIINPEKLKDVIFKNYDSSFGARNVERILRQKVQDKIARLIIEQKIKEGDILEL
ncbi:MAG: ATP-dependent Clp protease ATP-binding subunit [Candidatus Roizmanbacteria bacterium]|nr:MAG: ATP-dependent Clp protease ATP-binding subunit [Candidatus Roizmanbacteria bacterium]